MGKYGKKVKKWVKQDKINKIEAKKGDKKYKEMRKKKGGKN